MADELLEDLRQRWWKIADSMSDEARNNWWTIIQNKYTEDCRKYHNITHIHKMFQHFDSYQQFISSPKAVAYAIFFHDLEYDPKAGDNEEKSAERFKQFSKEATISENSDLIAEVTELILLTKTHITEEHKSSDIFGKEDKHFFLDFDVSILGSENKEYDIYAENIRQEYSFLPVTTYNSLRAKVLKSFLQIPNIFSTQQFREMYEDQAKRNIQREIKLLESRT
ncbi:uncharacterized protein LOC111624632 [Centruroides sculpturatus]|uniref:uncharacterized protein LOC111624632 n=1 Tax=Centruroides sculpturatus TaxID=218467 RepID=UPI000C6CD228|nr:uncharacterized protein LOC111624632 [Centruroides sculpturatus]